MKISFSSKEAGSDEIIKALAIADGWRNPAFLNYVWVGYPPNCPAYPEGSPQSLNLQQLPNYLKSRDAIIALILKRPMEIQSMVAEILQRIICHWGFCSAEQYCKAFLVAEGVAKIESY